MAATKIATCCYCGAKTALGLRGRDRHELACGQCGAPLSRMKMLPSAATSDAAHARQGIDHRIAAMAPRTPPKPKKRKGKKSFGRRAFAELWDVIEDIID